MAKKDPALLSRQITAGLQERALREPRWQRNRANYYNDPQSPSPAPYQEGRSVHLPIVQPVGDDLCAMVCATITSGNPYMVAQVYGTAPDGNEQEKLERVLQFFAENSGLRDALRRVAVPAFWSNLGWIKTEWEPGMTEAGLPSRLPKFRFTVLEPTQMVVYPAWSASLQQSTLHGESIKRSKREIEQLMDAGHYLKQEIPSTPGDDAAQAAMAESSPSGKPLESDSDPAVILWDVICKGKEGTYRAIVDQGGKALYKWDQWYASESRYAEFGFKPKVDIAGYFPDTSVAQDLQELQAHGSDLMSIFIHGSKMNTYGTAFMGQGADTAKAATKYGPGDVITGNVEGMQIYSPKADLGVLPTGIQMILTLARQVARVSLNAAGNGDQALGTATEAMIAQQGQQNVTDDYLATFGAGLKAVYAYMQKVLADEWANWFPVYGRALELEEGDQYIFRLPVLWRLNVDSLGAAPQAQFASAMQLMQLAGVPGSGIDIYELTKRVVDSAERSGLSDAQDLQLPRDTGQLVDVLAERFQVEPELLEIALQQVLQQADAAEMGGMEGIPGGQGLNQGLGIPAAGGLGGPSNMQPGGFAPMAGPTSDFEPNA